MIEKREENEAIESTADSGKTDKKNETPRTIMKVGNKTYLVGRHFNPDSEETMKDKVIRMIKVCRIQSGLGRKHSKIV